MRQGEILRYVVVYITDNTVIQRMLRLGFVQVLEGVVNLIQQGRKVSEGVKTLVGAAFQDPADKDLGGV